MKVKNEFKTGILILVVGLLLASIIQNLRPEVSEPWVASFRTEDGGAGSGFSEREVGENEDLEAELWFFEDLENYLMDFSGNKDEYDGAGRKNEYNSGE